MKAADRESVEVFEIPELLLMEHAALALVNHLEKRFGEMLPRSRGVVLAGNGNNGGDVLAATRLLLERGCQNIFVVIPGALATAAPHTNRSSSTQKQLALLSKLGFAWGTEVSAELLAASDWILDGLLGTGLSREVEGEFLARIELLNQFAGKKWIVSADIPSGLSADTGNPLPTAVRASATVTFGFYKRGLVTGEAVNYVGQLTLAPIQIPRLVSSEGWDSFLYTDEDAIRLPIRRQSSHKGDFGKVSIVAGPADKEGAAALAALGALKAGAGLVTVFAEESTLASLRPRLAPEVMTSTLVEGKGNFPAASAHHALVIGPGLGVDVAGWKVLETCLRQQNALILDADALTLLAQNAKAAQTLLAARESIPTVLTPHPKEAALLLGSSVEEVQGDRFTSVRTLAEKWHCAVILKGAGSLCTSPRTPTIAVRAGDSGLSKGGTGDVLTGILASLLAQRLSLSQAVPLAIYLHGRASELLTRRYGHSRSSLASEVATAVADVLRNLESQASR